MSGKSQEVRHVIFFNQEFIDLNNKYVCQGSPWGMGWFFPFEDHPLGTALGPKGWWHFIGVYPFLQMSNLAFFWTIFAQILSKNYLAWTYIWTFMQEEFSLAKITEVVWKLTTKIKPAPWVSLSSRGNWQTNWGSQYQHRGTSTKMSEFFCSRRHFQELRFCAVRPGPGRKGAQTDGAARPMDCNLRETEEHALPLAPEAPAPRRHFQELRAVLQKCKIVVFFFGQPPL